jgi:hypothetical protein
LAYEYKPQTIGELIKLLSDLDPSKIIVGALFTAEDLELIDEDTDTEVEVTEELMAKVAEDYDNSDEAMFLSETLTGWITENYEAGK